MSWDILPKNRIQYIFEKLKTVIPDKESKSASQGGTDLSLVTTGEKYTWNNKSDFSGSYNDLSNKPTIPDELADLSEDSTHRLVTDAEKATWNGKSNFSGSYNDLTNKPTLGTASAKNINNTYSPTSEDVATGKTIADAFDYFGFSVVNGKLCQTYTV